jgi:hypothetical protein
MRNTISRMYVVGALVAVGCAAGSSALSAQAAPSAGQMHSHPDVAQSGMQPGDGAFVETIRGATAAFKSLDAAEKAGYPRTGGPCLARPGVGGMGFHHMNDKLMDDKLEVEHPEVLVYYKTPSGEYTLNGVEYYVPFSAHPGTAEPPTVAGRPLKKFEQGKFWYLHAWVWLDNPMGLNADWNPKVTCG